MAVTSVNLDVREIPSRGEPINYNSVHDDCFVRDDAGKCIADAYLYDLDDRSGQENPFECVYIRYTTEPNRKEDFLSFSPDCLRMSDASHIYVRQRDATSAELESIKDHKYTAAIAKAKQIAANFKNAVLDGRLSHEVRNASVLKEGWYGDECIPFFADVDKKVYFKHEFYQRNEQDGVRTVHLGDVRMIEEGFRIYLYGKYLPDLEWGLSMFDARLDLKYEQCHSF